MSATFTTILFLTYRLLLLLLLQLHFYSNFLFLFFLAFLLFRRFKFFFQSKLLCDLCKHFFNAFTRFCWNKIRANTYSIDQRLYFRIFNTDGEIGFISNNIDESSAIGIVLSLLKPILLNFSEWFRISEIVYYQHDVCTYINQVLLL